MNCLFSIRVQTHPPLHIYCLLPTHARNRCLRPSDTCVKIEFNLCRSIKHKSQLLNKNLILFFLFKYKGQRNYYILVVSTDFCLLTLTDIGAHERTISSGHWLFNRTSRYGWYDVRPDDGYTSIRRGINITTDYHLLLFIFTLLNIYYWYDL